jgi:hypothetical protein
MNGNYNTSPEEESATGRPDRDLYETVMVRHTERS